MSNSFDQHWQSFEVDQFPEGKMRAAEEFLRPLLAKLPAGSRVLDVGCGDGAQAAYLRDNFPELNYVGIDIADVVMELNKHFPKDRFSFEKASALDLPFEDNSFDAAFSFGVLGYTGDAHLGFREMVRVLKPGGRSALWLFEDQGGLAQKLHGLISGCLRLLPGPLGRASCYLLSPILWVVPNKSGIHLGNSSWRKCAEIVAVNLLYPVDFFSGEELESWHRDAGLSDVTAVAEQPLTYYAKK